MRNLPDTCSTREAASRLNVALSTVQSWVESGFLEAWKTPGGHRRVTIESVDRLLARGMGASKSTQQPPLRILVVEDEPEMRDLYVQYIESWGLPVTVSQAVDGYEGLLLAGLELPDLMISDLAMPDMDGFKMIATLRARNNTSDMSIVVVSGLSPAEILERGPLPPDIRVLPKPVPFDELQRITERLLAARSKPGAGRP